MTEENKNPEPEFQQNENPKPEQTKSGIWTLIIGLILVVRGGMRFSQSGLEIFGVVMIVIGLGSLYVYFKDRI